ncbi:MAG TPA: ATP synthase subunit I [Burkholderiales bacterium]|nr:ATP synthase subunit I [Burkholderiales bacterium]
MSHAGEILSQGIRSVLLSQVAITFMTAAIAFAFLGSAQAVAASYGGGVALISTWLLGRRISRIPEVNQQGNSINQLTLFAGVLPRFIVTLALLAVGIGWLKLAPIPLIVAFALAQLGFAIVLGITRHPRA